MKVRFTCHDMKSLVYVATCTQRDINRAHLVSPTLEEGNISPCDEPLASSSALRTGKPGTFPHVRIVSNSVSLIELT